MSISIVTKLQLDFHLDLVKKFFCAIGEFEDLAALMSWSYPDENVHAEKPGLYFQSRDPFLETQGAPWSPFPPSSPAPWGQRGVKEGILFPRRTPCFSLVPVLGHSDSRCRVSEPLRRSRG
ncbi:unnamed protein product [Nyctereutes procyonoides]|uniref:(raccoon dog) hypothetical protein n=1 Tax=Nyctereutes procyonoides TaxID=34880 RepID=A0A811Y8V4_NYCPR|nr:unnamed protein product [Nyctereutes procyonoides]